MVHTFETCPRWCMITGVGPCRYLLAAATRPPAWSTRTSHNGWKRPCLSGGCRRPERTAVSARILRLHVLHDAQPASRCIHVALTIGVRTGDTIALNQVFNAERCESEPGFAELFSSLPQALARGRPHVSTEIRPMSSFAPPSRRPSSKSGTSTSATAAPHPPKQRDSLSPPYGFGLSDPFAALRIQAKLRIGDAHDPRSPWSNAR